MTPLNFLVAGVGGQGTLLASDILAEVGIRSGCDAKKSDVLGLAVRGGSVLSHVRWGDRIASPVIGPGEVDFMLAFEPLEAMRGIPFLRSESVVVCNTQPVIPISVSSGTAQYPGRDEIERALRGAASVIHFVDATSRAIALGTPRVANVVLLGAFSTLVDVDPSIWETVVLQRVPARYEEMNRAAFRAGRALLNRKEEA